MTKPGISCFCSTYGRPKILIENSIQCFLEQDYDGPKELVILNDFIDQKLIFNHPDVRIINYHERIKPLGKKFNMNVEFCNYDILAVWEDDDVFLKNRLSYSFENMKNGVFHTKEAFVERSIFNIKTAKNYFHSQHMFTRDLFEHVGGYEEQDICSIDVSIMKKIENVLGPYSQDMKSVNDYMYIYVWPTSGSFHGSGMGVENQNISDSAALVVSEQVKKGIVLTGDIFLKPKLRYNFYDFLPNNLGMINNQEIDILYGESEENYVNVTSLVIQQCVIGGGSWKVPSSDLVRSKIFGDHLPNILKHMLVRYKDNSKNILIESNSEFDFQLIEKKIKFS